MHLFVPTKFDYVRGRRPRVACILCEIVARRETVVRLEVHRTALSLVSLNLHPYNPGHLLLFPLRHIQDLSALTEEEVLDLHRATLLSISVLGRLYGPHGYNGGWNIGRASGASIDHVHMHVVPRYDRELGFMDIIGGKKIVVEDPGCTVRRLCEAFREEGGEGRG